MAFAALGDVVAGAILQTGRFRSQDATYVWGILAGSCVGLLASTFARLYASGYWALRDTRTPLRYAVVRVALTGVLGYLAAVPLPVALGIDPKWGAAGLTASAGAAGWVEFVLLRRTLSARIGAAWLPGGFLPRLWTAAAMAGALGYATKLALPPAGPLVRGLVVLPVFGAAYLGATMALGLPQARALTRRLLRGGR